MRNRINTKKPYLCFDCGKPVGRRVKRCEACNVEFLKIRPTYKRTPESKRKMSIAMTGKQTWLKGVKRPEVGKKISKAWTPEMKNAARERGLINAENREWLVKIAESVTGELNPNFQGKNQESPYAPGWGRGYRSKIRSRAEGICEWCNKKQKKSLDLHHKDFDKFNHDPENLAVICRQCHKIAHAEHKKLLLV